MMQSLILELVCKTMHVIKSKTESELQGEHFMVSRVRDYVQKVPILYNAHIYKTAIQPILTYGCSTLNLKHTDINELEKVQASLIKTALGLPKYSRNTPILRALNIKKISRIINERHSSLTKAALHNTSKSRTFFPHIMHKCQYYRMDKHSNLLQRSKIICTSNQIMLHKYLFEKSYALKCKRRFECDIADGIVDSIYSFFLHL